MSSDPEKLGVESPAPSYDAGIAYDPEKSGGDSSLPSHEAAAVYDLEKSGGDSASPSHDAGTFNELDDSLTKLGYKPELRRNRSLFTLLFQSLAIAAIPFGVGGPLISSIYGGGQLSIFVGWIMVLVLNECIALSLSELASRFPTSAGPYYWSFQVAKNNKTLLSFITGWVWLIGNVSWKSICRALISRKTPRLNLECALLREFPNGF